MLLQDGESKHVINYIMNSQGDFFFMLELYIGHSNHNWWVVVVYSTNKWYLLFIYQEGDNLGGLNCIEGDFRYMPCIKKYKL